MRSLDDVLCADGQVRPDYLHTKHNLGVFQSGQMGRTVNALAYAFGGSNPSTPTNFVRLIFIGRQDDSDTDSDSAAHIGMKSSTEFFNFCEVFMVYEPKRRASTH